LQVIKLNIHTKEHKGTAFHNPVGHACTTNHFDDYRTLNTGAAVTGYSMIWHIIAQNM